MADLLVDEQAPAATPAAGSSLIFPHNYSTLKQWAIKNSDGQVQMLPGIRNSLLTSAGTLTGNAYTYFAGSAIAVPSHGLQVGTILKWTIFMQKDAAGTATPLIRLYSGTLGTTGDTVVTTLTFAASTAVVDTACLTVWATVKSIGATGLIQVHGVLMHNLSATGFQNIPVGVVQNSSSAFDTTPSGLILGLAGNPGTGATWQTYQVIAEAFLL